MADFVYLSRLRSKSEISRQKQSIKYKDLYVNMSKMSRQAQLYSPLF